MVVTLRLAAIASDRRPAAGSTLWQMMLAASKGAPSQFFSTHPSGENRIKDIQGRLARVDPLFDAAAKPARRFSAPTA